MFSKIVDQNSLILRDETMTLALGKALATALQPGNILFLQGELGAGKTSCVAGILRGFGFEAAVKSPSYTLVEEYKFSWGMLYHFDLYRLKNPEELTFMGFRDYLQDSNLVLIEWPEKGQGFLPKPDLLLQLFHIKENPRQRQVMFQAETETGVAIVKKVWEMMQKEKISDQNGKSL